jgi:general stress protein CsbA
MIPNIGSMDRKVRSFVIAPLLVILAIIFHSITWLMVVLLVLAVVMLATSAIKVCPLYMPFKLSTLKK